jgi:hypothetical protein
MLSWRLHHLPHGPCAWRGRAERPGSCHRRPSSRAERVAFGTSKFECRDCKFEKEKSCDLPGTLAHDAWHPKAAGTLLILLRQRAARRRRHSNACAARE